MTQFCTEQVKQPEPKYPSAGADTIAHSVSAATSLLMQEVDEVGISKALRLPKRQPSWASRIKHGYFFDTQTDNYSYVAGKTAQKLGNLLVNEYAISEPHAQHIKGFYGMLGTSLTMRMLQKGAEAYSNLGRSDPSTEELSEIMENSYPTVAKFCNWDESFGGRLESLYKIGDRYKSFRELTPLQSAVADFDFEIQDGLFVAKNWQEALTCAKSLPAEAPELPSAVSGVCPAITKESYVEATNASSLQTIWNLGITVCASTSWLWEKDLKKPS